MSLFWKIYRAPAKYVTVSVPIILLLGFITGLVFDTSALKPTILIGTIIMIYATMIGFDFKQLTSLKDSKLLIFSLLINFLIIPLIAYILGVTLLTGRYDGGIMFAGLAISALLPTSGMTISWTMMQKGNVEGAVKLTIFGLIIGSILAPWYLYVMVGQYVPIDILATMKTILLIVFVPMVLGNITAKLILRKKTKQEFKEKIKPKFGPLSIWGMLYVIFISISNGSELIMKNLNLVLLAIIVLLLFYAINFAISTFFAVRFFDRKNGIALVNGTVLRNLSIAIGIAATSFGSEAALIVTLAFIIQQQGITNYVQFAKKRWFKEEEALSSKG